MKTLKTKKQKIDRTLASVMNENKESKTKIQELELQNKELKLKIEEQQSFINFLIEWRKRKVREI